MITPLHVLKRYCQHQVHAESRSNETITSMMFPTYEVCKDGLFSSLLKQKVSQEGTWKLSSDTATDGLKVQGF